MEIRLDLEKWGELTAYFSVLKNINIGTESLDNKLEAAAKLIIP